MSRNPNFKKWQARLGKTKQTKAIYLGTFGESYNFKNHHILFHIMKLMAER